MSPSYWFALVGSVVTLAVMAELLRRRRLREKFAVLWLVVGVGVLVFSVVPGLLFWLARILGIAAPINLVFFVAALVLLVVSVQLSAEISTLEDENRVLAEEIGVLRLRVERLERPAAGDAPAGNEVNPADGRSG